MSTGFCDGINDGLPDLRWHITTRATEVEVTILFVNEIIDELHVLRKAVSYINLFLLFATERGEDVCEHTFFVIFFKLSLVTVFLAVACTKEQSHFPTLLTSPSCHHTF